MKTNEIEEIINCIDSEIEPLISEHNKLSLNINNLNDKIFDLKEKKKVLLQLRELLIKEETKKNEWS